MTDEATPAQDNRFRAVIGFIAVVGSMAAFGGLFYFEIPARNENALMFAMGIIFGWGSSVFASEYGASSIGRKVAEGAVKRMERQPVAPVAPVAPVDAPSPVPEGIEEAVDQVADAAVDKAGKIKGKKGG